MKTNTTYLLRRVLAACVVVLSPIYLSLAAETNTVSSGAATPTPTVAPVSTTAPAPEKLPYGVGDILKLSRAQIGDEIILNYVQNSGTIYNLASKDVLYLHDQGVSDKVLNAMLTQRNRVELATQAPSPQAPAAPVMTTAVDPNMVAQAEAPAGTEPNTTYAQAPLTPPASSMYVIPYPAASYAYYGASPYYYGGWYGPSVSIGFGYCGYGYYGHGYYGHGGYHGGHGSSAVHGGGGHH